LKPLTSDVIAILKKNLKNSLEQLQTREEKERGANLNYQAQGYR
jgi:hypothetical protein